MAKRKRINSPLLFVKKIDSKGRKYFLDTNTGKRTKEAYYNAQFSSFGRVTKETTYTTIKLLENEDISPSDIREVNNDLFKMDYNVRNAEAEEAIKQRSGYRSEMYFNAGKTIEEAQDSGFRIMIKGVDDFKFREFNETKQAEEYEKFIDFANDIMAQINKGKKSKNYVTFNVNIDLTDETYYIDFTSINPDADASIMEDLLDQDL